MYSKSLVQCMKYNINSVRVIFLSFIPSVPCYSNWYIDRQYHHHLGAA
jgi:hypothetical protein